MLPRDEETWITPKLNDDPTGTPVDVYGGLFAPPTLAFVHGNLMPAPAGPLSTIFDMVSWPDASRQDLLQVLHPQCSAKAITLLLLTGCRLGEVLGLQWQDVKGNRLMLRDSKTGPCIVWLGQEARALIATLPKRKDVPWLFWHQKLRKQINVNGAPCPPRRRARARRDRADRVCHRAIA